MLNERWYADDEKWNAKQLARMREILDGQKAIQKELATQTLRLDDIDTLINTHWKQREQRFEELENEHKAITSALTTSQDDFQYRLGLHNGAHKLIEKLFDRYIAACKKVGNSGCMERKGDVP